MAEPKSILKKQCRMLMELRVEILKQAQEVGRAGRDPGLMTELSRLDAKLIDAILYTRHMDEILVGHAIAEDKAVEKVLGETAEPAGNVVEFPGAAAKE